MYKHSKRSKQSYTTDYSKLGNNLTPGVKGFLCTFNNREKDCIREAYNILNKYADQLYGPETQSNTNPETTENNIEDDLKNELKELKSESIKKKRFQVVKSGAKNVLFIKTIIDDPVKLTTTIINDLRETQKAQTRFLYRLIPIEVTCKGYLDDIKKTCSEILDKHFKDNDKSFSIVYNRRNNNHLDRDEVIKTIAGLVQEIPGKHVVNLNNPDVTIIIEIIKNVALLSVVCDYVAMKKFNLLGFIPNQDKKEDCDIKEEVKDDVKEEVKDDVKEEVKEEKTD